MFVFAIHQHESAVGMGQLYVWVAILLCLRVLWVRNLERAQEHLVSVIQSLSPYLKGLED